MSVGQSRSLLLISYAFPPTGGAGVQRATKFVKFLPRYGWQPTVLTVSNPSVPVQDENLASDVHPHTTIVRAPTWEPNYQWKSKVAGGSKRGSRGRWLFRTAAMGLLQPDPQILWNSSAFQAASRALRETPVAAIFVTGPPFSSFLLGCKLKKKFDLPLVLDFRDEWGLVNRHLENHLTGRWSGWRQSRMRRHALRWADAVIATTARSAQQLQQECLQLGARAHVECIYNGFDSDDLPVKTQDVQRGEGAAKLRIVYTGTLWNLTDIGPLLGALRRMDAEAPIELHVAGRRTDVQQALLSELDVEGVTVRTYDYLPHQAALRLASTADVLLLTLSDAPGAERVVPAKLFEYMALQKEILAIVPNGEAREILAKYPNVGIFHPRSTFEIAGWLSNALQRQRTAQSSVLVPLETLRDYSRSAQAEQLSEILQGISADYSASG